MKKLTVAVTLSLVLLFASCSLFNRYSTVINNSSHTVSFKWNRSAGEIIVLNTGESSSINQNIYRIVIVYPNRRVTQNWSNDYNISIVDLSYYVINIKNNRNHSVVLSADGWMGLDPVALNAHENRTGVIYTTRPRFHANSETFPVNVVYQFNNNVCFVSLY